MRDFPGSKADQIWEAVAPHVKVCTSTLMRYKKDGGYVCRLVGAGLFLLHISSDVTFC
jgi:hypothetical protein